MKKLLIIVFLMSFGVASIMAQEQKEFKGIVKVQVDGLSCPFCAYGLEKKLKNMDGVTKIEIDVENAFALLTIEKGKTVTDEVIRQKVKDAGFTAREITEVSNDE
jgi:mercuric ion binding protein